MVKKSPTEAVPLYCRTGVCGVLNLEVESHPTSRHANAKSRNRTVFMTKGLLSSIHRQREPGAEPVQRFAAYASYGKLGVTHPKRWKMKGKLVRNRVAAAQPSLAHLPSSRLSITRRITAPP